MDAVDLVFKVSIDGAVFPNMATRVTVCIALVGSACLLSRLPHGIKSING